MRDIPLGLLLGVGIPVFVIVLVGSIFFFVFRSIVRSTARARGELEAEGIVLDTGPRWITIRFANFRAPGLAVGVGVRKTRGALVLTQRRLVVLPSRRQFYRVERQDLARYTVSTDDGALVIHSDDPPNASGSITYRLNLGNASEWMKALAAAGARVRST